MAADGQILVSPRVHAAVEELVVSTPVNDLELKGFAHPARFTDLSRRKVIPKSLLTTLPSASIYSQIKFASSGQQTYSGAR